MPISTGTRVHLVHAISSVAFAPPDRVLYVKSGTLVTQRLDLGGARLVGDSEPVGESLFQIGDMMLSSPHESAEPAAVAVLNWTEGLRKP